MNATSQHTPEPPARSRGAARSRLAWERRNRGWSQQQLADQLDVTPATISRWERGERLPDLYYWAKLSALFGVSVTDLGLLPTEAANTTEPAEPPSDPPGLPLSAKDVGTSRLTDEAHRPSSSLPLESRPEQAPHPARRRWRLALGAAFSSLAALLLVTGILTRPWPLSALGGSALAPRAAAVGTIAFGSSEQFRGNSGQGMNDVVTITLPGLPAPTNATCYFAWMAGGAGGSEVRWRPLGRLNWTRGTAWLSYRSPLHTNLLALYSRFLITREATGIPPLQPSSAWLFTASISSIPTPGDPNHYSLLDHLRHLLAADPALIALGIQGGLDAWLARNTEQVLALAKEAQQEWQTHQVAALHQQIIRILDYLDGSANVEMDVPASTPLLVPAPFARVGLVTLTADQHPPGYLLHTDLHLQGVSEAVGATPFQRRLADQLRAAMNAVGLALANARESAIAGIDLTPTQLAQLATLPLLRDLAQQAQDACDGPPSSPTNTAFAGVSRLSIAMQHLATFSWQQVTAAS